MKIMISQLSRSVASSFVLLALVNILHASIGVHAKVDWECTVKIEHKDKRLETAVTFSELELEAVHPQTSFYYGKFPCRDNGVCDVQVANKTEFALRVNGPKYLKFEPR